MHGKPRTFASLQHAVPLAVIKVETTSGLTVCVELLDKAAKVALFIAVDGIPDVQRTGRNKIIRYCQKSFLRAHICVQKL